MGVSNAPRHVLLIGPDAAALAGYTANAARFTYTHVQSFVEAILTCAPDTLPFPYDLIVAGVTQDQINLNAAVAAFRKVHPAGRLLLLCDAYQEPTCRCHLPGADDYVILPAAPAQIFAFSARPPARNDAATRREGPSRQETVPRPGPSAVPSAPNLTAPDTSNTAAHVDPLQLPMVLQTALMNGILQGAADLLRPRMATLQCYFRWPGTLRIVAIPPADMPPNTLCFPLVHDERDFGCLLLEGARAEDQLNERLAQAGALAYRMDGARPLMHQTTAASWPSPTNSPGRLQPPLLHPFCHPTAGEGPRRPFPSDIAIFRYRRF